MKKNCLPQVGHNLSPWTLNSSKAECRADDHTSITRHNKACDPDSNEVVYWTSYTATGEPMLNMKFGADYIHDLSAAIAAEGTASCRR